MKICWLFLALPVSLAEAQVWTVDDSGPADFATIQAAVSFVPPGSVLVVQPGDYAGFSASKRLAILGPGAGPRPRVKGTCTISAAGGFTMSGLEFLTSGGLGTLVFQNVGGPAVVDDCVLPYSYYFSLSNCGQCVITRTQTEHAGISASASELVFVQSTIVGQGGTSMAFGSGTSGYPALSLSQGTGAMVAGCQLTGGPAGFGVCPCGDGAPGKGIVANASSLVLRGSGMHHVQAAADPGCYCGSPVPAIQLDASVAVLSGATWGLLQPTGSSVTLPQPAEPYLVVAGSSAPGAIRTLKLYGPAGAPGIVAVSRLAPQSSVAGLEGPVWLNLAGLLQVFGLVTQGQDVAVTHGWQLPPSLLELAGLEFVVQAAFPTLAGTLDPTAMQLTNPDVVVLRF